MAAPWRRSSASGQRVGPRRGRSAPCHAGRNRANAAASTGSTSRRSAASERRADPTQHVGVAPFALEAAGAELAVHDAAAAASALERLADAVGVERRAGDAIVGRDERTVGAGVASDEVVERMLGGAR